MKRYHIFISGIVIGVYFRGFIKNKADKLGIKGWVKNTTNGRVEAVFEGEEPKLDEIIEYCRHGPWTSQVENVEVIAENYTGKLRDFSIIR